jgi:hypothetical protein
MQWCGWVIRRVVETLEGPRLEHWGVRLSEDFTEGWFDPLRYSDYLRQVSTYDWLCGAVELRSDGPLPAKPDAAGLTGCPEAEAIPARW